MIPYPFIEIHLGLPVWFGLGTISLNIYYFLRVSKKRSNPFMHILANIYNIA